MNKEVFEFNKNLKQSKNIENIKLWLDNPDKSRVSEVVRVDFKFPCTWTILHVDEILEILRLWVIGEDQRDWGRELFIKEVNRVLNSTPKNLLEEYKQNEKDTGGN